MPARQITAKEAQELGGHLNALQKFFDEIVKGYIEAFKEAGKISLGLAQVTASHVPEREQPRIGHHH